MALFERILQFLHPDGFVMNGVEDRNDEIPRQAELLASAIIFSRIESHREAWMMAILCSFL